MKKQLLRFTLYALMVYLIGSILNPPIAASHPLGEHETHFFGVIDGQRNKRPSDQFPNRNYARTFAANLNVGEPYTVRLIYFLPSDRQPQPDIDAKMDALIKGAQHHYAEMMEKHGFGRKTFRFETDVTGKAVVHHVNGKFNDVYYQDHFVGFWDEIREQLSTSSYIYLVALETSTELINNLWCGYYGGNPSRGGVALIPASGGCFDVGVTAHELGHAFGLKHDLRANGNWISTSYISDPMITWYISDRMITSFCAAEWLDVHRYFNANQSSQNASGATVQMFPPSLAFPPNGIRLRFEISDTAGLHQVQLLTPEIEEYGEGGFLACKRLDGNPSSIVEFVTTALTTRTESVYLQMIDVHGNFSWSEQFPIDITPLLPPSKVVSIPDANLASAIQHKIGWPITTHAMLNLYQLNIFNRQITDLTGLKHAPNLRRLDLGGEWANGRYVNSNEVSNFSPLLSLPQLVTLDLGGNSISDISALAGLTQLTVLDLRNNSISDISALGGLTRLTRLDLLHNSISDISALADLTQLTVLSLQDNSISDISALAGLTQLASLGLWHNSISDISALAGLTQLTELDLWYNSISDISALADLTQLASLSLQDNSISDISALAGLTQLTELNLWYNSISDISALAGLTQLTELGLGGNPLSYASIHTHIPILQSRGVTVEFNNQAYPALLKISGDNQNGASFAPLSNPYVVEAQDANGSVLAGISVTFAVTAGGGTLSTTATRTDANGRAQSTLTLGPNLGTNTVEVSAAGIESKITFYAISDTELSPMIADVNNDSVVNVLDLIFIASAIGNAGTNLAADVNRDGVVSILDLVLAAGMFEGAAAAPSAQRQVPETLTAVEVQGWLTDAMALEIKDVIIKKGVMVLEQLLVSLIPRETELLANYPNPFNPETWIPYRLAEDGFVTLTIYDTAGQVVRTIEVGHRIAAAYESQPKAIHWDGENNLGEGVASGIYFYTLKAGDYSATRKMLILK